MSKSLCDEIGLDKFIWTEYMAISIVHVSLKATLKKKTRGPWATELTSTIISIVKSDLVSLIQNFWALCSIAAS